LNRSSSTSAEPLDLPAAIDATDLRSNVQGRGIVSLLSSGTLGQLAIAKFVGPASFREAIEKSLAHPHGHGSMVTYVSLQPGGSMLFDSPTFQLTREAFESVGRLHPIEHQAYECGFGFAVREYFAPTSLTVHIVSSGDAAPLSHLPGILSSTHHALGIPQLVQSKFSVAVTFAREEWFEDGVESKFSRALSTLLYAYGDAAVAAVERYLGSPDINTEIAVEAAQWLGDVDHPASRDYRKALLEKTLLHAPTSRLRHGAATGLAAIDDPSSYPIVLEARTRESNRGLRQFLQLVVDQLGRTRACPNS